MTKAWNWEMFRNGPFFKWGPEVSGQGRRTKCHANDIGGKSERRGCIGDFPCKQE